jgi:polysaccharide biosynthesis PFTS motif protein
VITVAQEMKNQLNLDVSVDIKQKRTPSSIHDPIYLSHISGLERASRMQIASPDVNLYSFVSEHDLIVVIPFSSPAYVAAHQGVPAVYYDPDNILIPTHDPHKLIQFARNRSELLQIVIEQASHKMKDSQGTQSCAS